MIWRPKPGQRVRIHYAKHYAHLMPYHGRTATVTIVATGPGPINAGLTLQDNTHVTVPRGNLYAVETKP